jgi:hypothetical protein
MSLALSSSTLWRSAAQNPNQDQVLGASLIAVWNMATLEVRRTVAVSPGLKAGALTVPNSTSMAGS